MLRTPPPPAGDEATRKQALPRAQRWAKEAETMLLSQAPHSPLLRRRPPLAVAQLYRNGMKTILAVAVLSVIGAVYAEGVRRRSDSPFACDRFALTPEARTRHSDELGPQLRSLKTGDRINPLQTARPEGNSQEAADFRIRRS